MFKTRLNTVLILVFTFLYFQNTFSQCFEIESILVDACDSGSNEGLNEMVRFKVGASNINTSTMSVTWPSNTWRNLLQDTTTAANVALINAQIFAAGGCGRIIEPIGGILPANSEVILITSNNFSLSLNVFGAITQNIYILFQNNPTNTNGHFANYNATSGLRTLSISFGASCSDFVTYNRSLLVNINGTYGPAFPDPTADTLNNGSTVNFTSSGTATYVNNGCVAPVPVFSVDAGTTPITACPGATVSLRGTAQGQQSVLWSASSGTFSDPTSLITNYSVPTVATGSITITLTATNPASCIASITDTVILNIGAIAAPIIDAIIQPTCTTATGSVTISGLPSGNWILNPGGILGSTVTTTVSGLVTGTTNYTVTNAAGCISPASADVLINAQPTTPSTPIIDFIAQPTCTTATGSVNLSGLPSGNWTLNPGGILGSTVTTTISGLVTGTTNYTVTNASGCVSLASANIVIDSQPSTPNAPIIDSIIQPTCTTATGSVAFSGLPSGNWILNPGGISGSTVTTTVSGLVTGTTNYTVTNASGCVSLTSANIVIDAQPSIPNAPIIDSIIQPTCTTATGSVALSGLPSGNWILNPGGISGSTATVTLSGLVTGTTNYTVTNVVGCTSSASANVLINPIPTTSSPTFSPIAPICFGTTLTLPLISNNGVSGTWLPLFDATATTTYTFTPDLGQCSSPTTLQIQVIPIPSGTAWPTAETICSLQSTGILLVGLNSETTFSWSVSQTNVSGALPDFGNSISQVLTATGINVGNAVYSITPTFRGCSGTPFTVTVSVTPKPILSVTNSSLSICSGNATGITMASSMPNTTYSWNVIQTNVIGASAGIGSAINQIVSTVGNASGEAVYAITPNVNGCPGATILATVIVNPIPTLTINPVLGQAICSGTATNISLSSSVRGTTFSWTEISTNTIGASSGIESSIAQTLTAVTPALANVIYTILPTSNGCIGASGSVTVTVKPIPSVTSPSVVGETICSGDSINVALIPSFIGTSITWTVTQNGVSGATIGTGNAISDTLFTTRNNSGTAIYTIKPILNSCSGLPILIPIVVNPLPTPTLSDGIICVDLAGVAFRTYTLNSGLNISDFSFQWFLEGILQSSTEATFEALLPGNYSVIATNRITGCVSYPVSSIVTASNPATSFSALVTTPYFSENATITASTEGGNGTYQFSLDYGPFQASPIFENVAPGQHTIAINDTNGCTNLIPISLNTIGYPTYFTPNGDGFHDYWNIIGLENQPTAKVYIFDRYGKLIKQISTKSLGWDGTYNGNAMPSSDYWFTIEYLEPDAKTFKAHFSLKR